ncbi:hypothetical protein [Pseudomonas putida]|uniref:hypothetical protein n=1 Tax=Pseudomonas putida TaxID=303 RepID=UPI003D97DF6C
MHTLFHVDTADIKALNDEQARALIARLCRAEIRKYGGSESAVTWGGDQRAKDGGVDVRVEINPPLGISGYLPNDNTAFQVKAEAFPPSKIPGEMAPKGVLRQAIRDLATTKGSYVIAATRDDTSESALDLRLNAMRDCLSANGFGSSPHVAFYDARKIADWAEQHPAIVAWVKHQLGKPLVGWRPYSGWAYQETTVDSEYLLDDRVKVFTPDAEKGINVSATIDRLRIDLSKGASVRIVGLSGVGKTRLVQALFDPRVQANQAPLSADDVLYTDLSDGPSPQPSAMLEALIEDGSHCVLVVDNCGADTHQKLTEQLKTSGNKIGLVTVEYDVRDDLPDATRCYRLEGSSDEVIRQLLQRRYPVLSISDVDTITAFSDGNARVAFALAATVTTTGELARLRDSELFKRLFHQKNVENEDLLRCAEAASILYSFDGEDDSAGSELNKISAIADVSLITLQRKLVDLQRRGLVQARSKWRAVLPHAIANRLAAQALEVIPKSQIVNIFADTATDRVVRSFSRRLGYLHESAKAAELIRDWLSPSGRFGNLTALNDIGHEIFHNIAPVSPSDALAAIGRAANIPRFLSDENSKLAQYAHTLKAIAFEEEDFDIAADILVRLALKNPQENRGQESIVQILKSLFFCVLSGTNAPPNQRAEFVRKLLESGDAEREQLGLLALDAALEAWHFTSVSRFDFGARKRSEGWAPVSRSDIEAWFMPFIRMALDIGKQKSDLADSCRTILGRRLRGLWVGANLRPEVCAAVKELASTVSWPQGWFGVKSILRFDLGKCDQSIQNELRQLENLLKPKAIPDMIRARLLESNQFDLDLDDDDADQRAETTGERIRRSNHAMEELGEAAATIEGLLLELLPQLISTKSGASAFHLGVGVGKHVADPSWILDAAKEHIATATSGTVGVFFLRGLLNGWHQVFPAYAEEFLDSAVSDAVWVKWIMDLHYSIPMNQAAYARIHQSIKAGNTPAWQYSYLGMGRQTDSLSVADIGELLSAIALLPDGGAVFLDVLSMVVHCASDHEDAYKESLAATCLNLLGSAEWRKVLGDRANSGYRLESILEFSLKRLASSEAALEVLNGLVAFARTKECSYSDRDVIKDAISPFLRHMPRRALDAIYVPGDEAYYRQMSPVIGRPYNDRKETALSVVPVDALIDWCTASPPDRYVFAARSCKLFDSRSRTSEEHANIDSVDDSELVISEAALAVLANAPDKKAVIECYLMRFTPSGWSGSLSEILKKRIPLLDALNLGNEEELKPVLATARASLERRIAAEELREDEEERERTGSFE